MVSDPLLLPVPVSPLVFPAVAASGVVLVAVSIAGIALPVIIRMQVIIQLENPVAVGTKINSWV